MPVDTAPPPTTADGDSRSRRGTRLLVHHADALVLGTSTGFAHGEVTLGRDAARACLIDPAFAEVEIHVTSPGDSTRIVHVLDIVEPRVKPDGGGTFPGFLGPARVQTDPDTHVLSGVSVLAAGYLPRNQEGIIDMSGPGAELSPYAANHNVVVTFTPADGTSWEDTEAAVRRGVLRLAAHLAAATVELIADEVREIAPPALHADRSERPRVGVITNLQTQGSFKDVFVYGRSLSTGLPTWIDPREVDDGAVVSGQYGHPGLRNSTYAHQNHPVVAELRARHGRDVDFAGLVLCPEPVEQGAKEHITAHAARLCQAAGFDAVIVTKEGAGNADADISLKLDALEDLGIHAVGLFAEMSGADGTGPPVVFGPRRATGMISTGNYDERITLPAVTLALGSDRVDIADADATAEMTLPTAAIHGSLNPLGHGRLTAAAVT